MEGEEVIGFKWFARGTVAPFTFIRWPKTGWISAPAGGTAGSGVHACRIAHLPFWVDEELWRVELGGAIVEHETQLEAQRGRLQERISSWNPAAFATACARRAAAVAEEFPSSELDHYAALSRTCGTATAAYIAAVAMVAARGAHAFAEERAWQAQWLARELGLRES
jgi:hypothetical protein